MFDRDTLFGPFAEIERLALPETKLSPPFEGVLGTFYSKLVGAAHDDTSWFVDHAGRSTGGDVLDLCCGGGRTAVALARRGWRVTAVDRSPTQLSLARARCRDAGDDVEDRVRILAGDVSSLDLDRSFDAVVIGGLSMTLFCADQRAGLLEVVRRHLALGGRLLFDYAPVAPGEREAELVLALPMRVGGQSGFVLVGGQREPDRRRHRTNLYGELVGADGRTRRWLTGFEFRLDEPSGMLAELAGHGFTVRDVDDRPGSDVHGEPDSPFGARGYVLAEAAA